MHNINAYLIGVFIHFQVSRENNYMKLEGEMKTFQATINRIFICDER